MVEKKECATCKYAQRGLFFTHRWYCGEKTKDVAQMEEVSPVDCCEKWTDVKKSDA